MSSVQYGFTAIAIVCGSGSNMISLFAKVRVLNLLVFLIKTDSSHYYRRAD